MAAKKRTKKSADAIRGERARITPDDIDDARATFKRDAPAGWGTLLDAKPAPESIEPPALDGGA